MDGEILFLGGLILGGLILFISYWFSFKFRNLEEGIKQLIEMQHEPEEFAKALLKTKIPVNELPPDVLEELAKISRKENPTYTG